MTRFGKLVLIGVLTGTLGLIGCGGDSAEAGTGGTGGTGGSGGSGGSGGTGGTGGGSATACSDGPLAETGQTGTADLACVATLPFDLTVRFNATPTAELQAGENTFDLQVEVAIAADTVNTVIDLAQEVTVNGATATIDATAGDSDPTPVDVIDEGVPCTLTFERDTDAVIVTTVSQGSWTLDDGATLELTLEALTQEVEALGLPVTLTTEGSEPSCQFVSDLPTVQFTLP